jgi:hypothetical protein
MNYKVLLLCSLTMLFAFRSPAQSDSETRTFMKSVKVSRQSSLEVSNKYGTIHITPWSKDSASIRAEVKAFASSSSKLNKMFDGISVNITETNLLVRAQTDFTQNIGMLFEDFKGMTSKLISYDSKVEIDYYISVPEYLNLKIENKYGDLYLENCTGTFSASVSNGSFKANSIGKGSVVTLSFCDATINTFKSGKIDASFSEITIGESEELTINSISSRYDIKNIGSIQTESKRDKFYITNSTTIKGNSYFSDFNLSNVSREIFLSAKYGSVTADMIDKKFESVNITSGYSDLSLEFEQGSSYNLDIRHINAFVVIPDRDAKTEKKALNEEKKEYMTFGTVGKSPGSAKVKIDATRGNIYIK